MTGRIITFGGGSCTGVRADDVEEDLMETVFFN
jgi:hypothetical protein